MAKAEVTIKVSPADFALTMSALEEAEEVALALAKPAADEPVSRRASGAEQRAARERAVRLQQLRQQLQSGGSR